MATTKFKLFKANGLNRRIVFPDQPSWFALASKIESFYLIPIEEVGVSYVDPDGDEIFLNNEEELRDFYKVPYHPPQPIKFSVVDLRSLRESQDDASKSLPDIPRRNTFGGAEGIKMTFESEGGRQSLGGSPVMHPPPPPAGLRGSKRQASPETDDDADGQPASKRKKGPRHFGAAAASALHANAWGKQWPQSEGIIHKSEIDDGETCSVDDDEISDFADKLNVPSHFNYRYFKEIQNLNMAVGAIRGRDFEDVLVVREEYERLRQELVDDVKHFRAIVVTGHPGIGKTAFLLYLLLHRLENRLPTAVQFDSNYYFIFDEKGATINTLPLYDPRLRECWALTDSNCNVLQPCSAFQSLAKCVILVSPPEPERWRKWIKQARGLCTVLDLPSVPEIAAIVKEFRKREIQLKRKMILLDPSSTLSLVRKWGPATRNIIRSMEYAALGRVDPIEGEAEWAAMRICNNPLPVFESSVGIRIPQIEGFGVIFLRRKPNGSVKSQNFIPTPHLLALFEEQRQRKSNKESLELFYELSSHDLTRTAAGWAHEKSMHERLCMGGQDLSIFHGPIEKQMRPSTRLLPGTLAGLKNAGVNSSFYWIPSVANFPGVNGVLGDTDGHVYIIQATIASTPTSPEQGIKKVWEQFCPEVRTSRTWHFVVITDSKHADAHVEEFSKKLRHITLGATCAHVQVWACVLDPF